MKQMRIFSIGVLLGLANLSHTAEEPKFISKTFQEIQSRALQRDPECGAILRVKPKEDASQNSFGLAFSIEEIPKTNEAMIRLSHTNMTGTKIYELYRLRLDDVMRQELQNQKRLKELEVERRVREIEEQKNKIAELSGGKLSYGMSLDAVIKVKGKPQKVVQGQAGGEFTAIYPDMELRFWMTRLTQIELPHQEE